MYIVENNSELLHLKNYIKGKTSYWFPMWADVELHPLRNSLSFIFVRCEETDYIISHKHTDTLSINLKDIEEVIHTEGIKWVFRSKRLSHTLKINPGVVLDIDVAWFLKTHITIDYTTTFQRLFLNWTSKGYYNNIISSIPILKLGEVIQSMISKYCDIDDIDYNFKWFNDKVLPILSKIEKTPIHVERKKFIGRYSASIKHLTDDNTLYTEYNPFTSTGRPSNRYGGINFSAINKGDGSREIFIPSDGKIFLQMDYDAYHIRLIGKLINFELPSSSVHQWLAEQYGVSYEEAKGVTFQLLYGGIPDEFLTIHFFGKVNEFIQTLWLETNKNGYLQTLKRRIPLKWIENPNPQKIFNYLIQAIETEVNIDKLEKILQTINQTDMNLVLYVYDSFLFEIPLEFDKNTIIELKRIIESGGFPIKASWGMDYSKI